MPSSLTVRELQLLRRLANGASNRELATTLYISDNTVKTYIRSAYKRIGVKSRTAAVLWAMRHGLVSEVDHQ